MVKEIKLLLDKIHWGWLRNMGSNIQDKYTTYSYYFTGFTCHHYTTIIG